MISIVFNNGNALHWELCQTGCMQHILPLVTSLSAQKLHISVVVPFLLPDYPSMTENSVPISKIVLVIHSLHLAVLYPSEIYKYYKISSYYLYIRRIMLPHLLQKLESVIYEYYLHYCGWLYAFSVSLYHDPIYFEPEEYFRSKFILKPCNYL